MNDALRAEAGSPIGILRLRGARRAHAPGPTAQLQPILSELAELKRAVATSQREVQAARQHIETLAQINLRLNGELMQLAQREAQVRDFAYHDELTGLPNRRLLRDRLNQAMAQGARQHKQVVLLLLDLDGFKTVNDRLGHAAGDELLQAVAQRLSASIRVADTACRCGGDEFVIMLPEVDQPGLAAAVAAKVRTRLSEPCIIDGHEIRLTASVGTVTYPADGQTYEELIRQADAALYRAKAASRTASITALPKETVAAGERRRRAAGERAGRWLEHTAAS